MAFVVDVFVDGVCLACHGAFVCGDLVGFYEKAISRDLHSFCELDDVANEKVVLVDLQLLAFPADGDSLAAVGHRVEL